MTAADRELIRAIEAARVDARKTWPGCYVSVECFGHTNSGAIGWNAKVSADADDIHHVRVLYVGPVCLCALDAIDAMLADDVYIDAQRGVSL